MSKSLNPVVGTLGSSSRVEFLAGSPDGGLGAELKSDFCGGGGGG